MKLNEDISPEIDKPHKYDVYGKWNKKLKAFDIKLIITNIFVTTNSVYYVKNGKHKNVSIELFEVTILTLNLQPMGRLE